MTNAPQITRREWRWAIIFSIVVVLLSALPYVIATVKAPPEWRFAGFLVNPLDGHSYLAKMAQGEQGRWLFHLTYTPEPHDGSLIFTFYLGLGHVARLTGLPKIVVFHLARLLAGLVLLLTAFWFIAHVTSRPAERRLAFALAATSAGLGWLGVLFDAFPIDLWVPEAFVPYSIYTNPHFPLGMALMLLIFGLLLRADPAAILKQTLLGGLAAFALAMILPFGLLTVWAVLALFLAWQYATSRRLPLTEIWLTLGVGVLSAPVIFYQYWVSTTNPVLAGWGAQNVTDAPAPLDFALGYGLVGLLAIAGGWQIIRQKANSRAEWLTLLWAGGTVALVYLPFDLQRRLITGLHLPLCLLAAIGLNRWLNRAPLKPTRKRLIIAAVIGVSAVGTLFVWGVTLAGALQSPDRSEQTAQLFIRRSEQAAFAWLQQQAAPDDVILVAPRLGMFAPGQTGARAYYGHPFETIQAEAKLTQVEAYFGGALAAVSPPATFVIYGPDEQALGRPIELDALTAVFEAGQVIVYHR